MPLSDWLRYSLSILLRVAWQCAVVNKMTTTCLRFEVSEKDLNKVLNDK